MSGARDAHWTAALAAIVLVGGACKAKPTAVGHLPAFATSVAIGGVRVDALGARVPSSAERASALARRVCNGVDVVRALHEAEAAVRGGEVLDSRALAGFGLDRLRQPSSLKASFACAKAAAASLGDARMAEIGWGDGAGAQRAVAVSSGSPSAPPWVPEPAHAFGAIEGRCAAACAPDLPAAIRLEGSWFSGEARAISAMATAFEKHESPSALLVDLARWADGADDGVVALKPAAVDLTVPCTEMAPVGGDAAPWLSGCFPARWAEEGQRLALRLDGLGIARVRPAASERFGFAYRLVAKDEANAEAVATALATFWSELVGTVDAGVVDLAKLAGKSSASKALFDTWLRAVRSARVERRGLTVDVVAETTLRDSERAELAAAGLPPDHGGALTRLHRHQRG
jgi:hypothetical protein